MLEMSMTGRFTLRVKNGASEFLHRWLTFVKAIFQVIPL